MWKIIKFEGALTLTHNATSLILLTGANRTTAVGDVGVYISEGSGNWRELLYGNVAASGASLPFVDSSPVVVGSADATKKVRFEVDGLTTATTRVVTVPDVDLTLPYKAGTYGSVQVFTGNGTWTKPAGLVRAKVTVIGGGGGSGNATFSAARAASGGAGGGGTSIKTIAAASLGATETVTVGAGGAVATAGGNSSFGAHCSATGGSATASVTDAFNGGAAAGIGSSGDLNFSGQPGDTANFDGVSPAGGEGGSSFMGGGGRITTVGGDTAGVAGAAYGGGASGASRNTAGTSNGAAGAAGVIFVEEFF